ncbi:MAG: glucose-1-phosphate adenylyltransferase [Blastocatellia bacterium]|nr:glucose-1-phosphate adenylyltransferase [Chloracidobacterium sp.]MBL8184964.1 glucose-1-phosphate adenylyltransferase [Blastocatellia bacterium]HBE82014.1 glucose-1-phosphate adenylyltransferase [Blastocatellia bacterium]HRJ88913.1 glucose-1-phosphate adenylyltransferase [Pyrinomonadaceae bacterium]HRK50403.1 glucose-1-phosphate adenylyltransferase [Pyrinomonadaceae bacterium]
MGQFDNVVAVILGGGAGSRLFPLTRERSKPAVPLGGKYRLIDVPVSNCINSNVTQIFVLTQYNSASLNRHISQTYRFSSFSTGFVEILAAEQTKESPDWFQGTADAVRQILPHLRDWRVGNLLILSGDHLYRMDYRKFLARHTETNADVTISVIPANPTDAEGFGLLKTDADGKIVEFREKPKGADLEAMRVDTSNFGLSEDESIKRPFLASMGIYVFNYAKLVELLNENPSAMDFGGEIIPSAIGSCNVQAHLFDSYWEDIGTIRAFYDANLDLASPLPKFNFFDTSAPIYTRSRYLPPSKLHGCDIDNSMVSEGCILNGVYARNSIIGLRSRIDSGARIENSILMGSDFFESIEEIKADLESSRPYLGIGKNTEIRRAIIDKNVRIGKNVKLLNESNIKFYDADDGSFYIREGIIIVPKGSTISDETVV